MRIPCIAARPRKWSRNDRKEEKRMKALHQSKWHCSPPQARDSISLRAAWILAAGLLCVTSVGCFSNLISPYSEQAYQSATSLKVESLLLMDKATDTYSKHASEAESL